VTATAEIPTPSATGDIDLSSLTGRIVFDNGGDIWSMNADGTDLTRLTDSPWREFDAAWSPDGTRIAYRAEPKDYSELWVMNADGSGKHRLANGGFPTWSADGSSILYADPGPPSFIAIINADGSGAYRVPNTDSGELPSWSPDGRRIAFSNNLSGSGRMYIVNPDGSGLVDLSGVGEGKKVDWSPDGQSILFASRRSDTGGGTDLYVMRPDGSEVKRLTNNSADCPAWSPDGRYIVAATLSGLFVMRADGSGITSIPTSGVREPCFPDWGP
jgi:TolB protein